MQNHLLKSLAISNSFACLMLGKFMLLIAWDWASGTQYFGSYALANGLVAGVMVIASLQARMLVMAHIRNRADFLNLRKLLLVLGVACGGLVLLLNWGFPMFILLALIIGQRVLENLVLAQASFEQVSSNREKAYGRINIAGFAIFAVYVIAPIWSLELALMLELVCLTLLVFWQNRSLPPKTDRAVFNGKDLFQIGLGFSLSAGMNAGLNSMLLYFCYQYFGQDMALMLAQILAIQAVIARVMASNSLYFVTAVSTWLSLNAGFILLLWAALLSGLLGVFSLTLSIISLAVFFTLINILNILLRQNLIARFGPKRLLGLHAAELLCFGALAIVATGGVMLFAIFTVIRAFRIPVLIRMRQLEDQEALA